MFDKYRYIIIVLILISCNSNIKNSATLKNDSIKKWILNSKNKDISLQERKIELSKVYQEINFKHSNLKYLPNVAYINLILGDTLLFYQQNKEALNEALKIKDSSVIGHSYRNYGLYYSKIINYDSAFYYFNKAQKYFKNSPNKRAKMILCKSNLYNDLCELNKSEEACIKALGIFRQIGNDYQVQSCYINLGVILKESKDYEESLKYYKKALEFKNKNGVYNNIGIVYKEMQDYDKAILYFNKELVTNASRVDYARVINNLANARILSGDTLGVYSKIKESFFIRDSLNSKSGILSSSVSLRNYYIHSKDTLKVIYYLNKIKDLSFEIKNSKEYLNSLLYLARYNAENKSKYLEKYIECKDSITQIRTKYLKKYARYSYDKDTVIEENKHLKEYIKFFIFGGFLFLGLFFTFFYLKNIRAQNEKLLLDNDQQKLNEELYLSAIDYHQKLKTLQIEERNRIAEDLHDGILSELFGVRLKLEFLSIKFNKKQKNEYDNYTKDLQDIEKKIRDVSHQLHTAAEPYAIKFEDALLALLEDKKNLGGFDLYFYKEESVYLDGLHNLIKVNLYRIFQETLQNIIKHAKANRVRITINPYKGKLLIIIQDNGVGFDVNKVKNGLGIKTIKSRIKKIKGKISFKGKKNVNRIEIIFPNIKKNE